MMVAVCLQMTMKESVLLKILIYTTPVLKIVMITFLTTPILMKLYQQSSIWFVTKNITKVYWGLYTLLLYFVGL